MTRDATRPVLVSDVGGTNTRIALVDGDGRQMAVRRYANDSFSSYYDAFSLGLSLVLGGQVGIILANS